jgi:hypothetical protein
MGSNTVTDLAIEHERVSLQRAYRDDEPVEAPHALAADESHPIAVLVCQHAPAVNLLSADQAGTAAERLGDERRLHAGNAG